MLSVYRRTDGQTAIARSSLLLTLITPIYTLLGLSRFLLNVTYNRRNAIYPGRQGRPGIKKLLKSYCFKLPKKLWKERTLKCRKYRTLKCKFMVEKCTTESLVLLSTYGSKSTIKSIVPLATGELQMTSLCKVSIGENNVGSTVCQ